MGKKLLYLLGLIQKRPKEIITLFVLKKLTSSEFNSLHIKDIRPNNMKNLIAVETINELTDDQIKNLTLISKLD